MFLCRTDMGHAPARRRASAHIFVLLDGNAYDRRREEVPVVRPATVAKMAGCGSSAGLAGAFPGGVQPRTAGCGWAACPDGSGCWTTACRAFGAGAAPPANSDRMPADIRHDRPITRVPVAGAASVIMTTRPASETMRRRLRAVKGSYRIAAEWRSTLARSPMRWIESDQSHAFALPCRVAGAQAGKLGPATGSGRGRPSSSTATKVKVASVTFSRVWVRKRRAQASTAIFIEVRPTPVMRV